VANLPYQHRDIDNFKLKMMAKITGQQNRDNQCVANILATVCHYFNVYISTLSVQ